MLRKLSFGETVSSLAPEAAMAAFTLTVDSRPWWQFRQILASCLLPKDSTAPLGNVTFSDWRTVNSGVIWSWQVVQASEFDGLTPMVTPFCKKVGSPDAV